MTPPSPFQIRVAQPADTAALAALGAATFTQTFGTLYTPTDLATFLETSHTPEVYAAAIADPAQRVWVVQGPSGALVAYATAGANSLPIDEAAAPIAPPIASLAAGRAGELKRIYVDASCQGAGLGSKLLAVVFDWLAEEKFAPLYIGVFSENIGAQKLYARHGFEKVGEYGFPVGDHVDLEFILRR